MVAVGRAIKQRAEPIHDSNTFKVPLVAELSELWHYRFLVWNLITRDLKVRYKRSFIGFVWVMLNPLLTMAVLTIVFANMFRWNINHFSIYLLVGILAWGFYSGGSNAAMNSLQTNGPILKKLYVPPTVFVSSAVGSGLVNFLFALGPFLLLSYIAGVTPSWTWAFLAVPMLLITLFTMGIALIIGSIFVFFRDVFEIYQVVLNAYYFATPIFYPLSLLPDPLRSLEQYNPMFLCIDAFRTAVISGSLPPLSETLPAAGFAVGALIIGWIIFTRVEARFVYYL